MSKAQKLKAGAPQARRSDLRTQHSGPNTRRSARSTAGAEGAHAAGLLRPMVLVAAAAVLVYLNGIPGDFVFDDKLIQRDPRISGQTSFWTIFVTDYWYKYIGTSADLYRPLTIASYALNFGVAGLSSPAFHVVNILLHALVCALVIALVDAVLRERSLAIVAGLLFATHPVHTEAVTGIVGRAEILTTLFLLVALYLHARSYTMWGQRPVLWLPVALVAYFCALLSKETAIVGPGLFLLVDAIRALTDDTQPARTWDLRRTIVMLSLYIGVAAIYVGIRYAVVGQFIQKAPPRSYLLLFGQPLAMRLFTACQIFAMYLRLLFVPVSLSADYSYRQVPLLDAPNVWTVVGFVAAAGLCGMAVWAFRKRVLPVVFGLGFFVVAYSVVSNLLIPLQVLVAERLMYLPSIGVCVGFAWLCVQLSRRCVASRQVLVATVAAIALLYGGRTFVRNFDWHDNETLYAATTRAAPECFAAHFNYAAILMRDARKMPLALEHLLKAYAIRQDHYPSLVNLSSAYMSLGQPEKAREIARHGLEVRPDGKELKGVLDAAEAQLRQRGAGGG